MNLLVIQQLIARMSQMKSEDMDASFKANAEYQVEQEQKIEARFDKVDGRLDKQGQKLDLILQLLQRSGE